MKNNVLTIPILVISAVILLIIAAVFMFKGGEDDSPRNGVKTGPDPIDVTLDFYNDWLTAMQTGSTSLSDILATTTTMTDGLKSELKTALDANAVPNPVLCMTELPPRVGAKEVFLLEDSAQYMILGRKSTSTTGQSAQVTLTKIDGLWMISGITCSRGEMAPEREFTFERRGHLLKAVPAPLDPNFWHLVFEENGQQGHTAALTFDATSACTYADGSERVCDTTLFTEAQEALVQGEATETGVVVKFLKLY